MTSGTAEVYADHEDRCVTIEFSGAEYNAEDGTTVTVPPTTVTLSPAEAREMAFRITLASYAVEGDTPDDDQP